MRELLLHLRIAFVFGSEGPNKRYSQLYIWTLSQSNCFVYAIGRRMEEESLYISQYELLVIANKTYDWLTRIKISGLFG